MRSALAEQRRERELRHNALQVAALLPADPAEAYEVIDRVQELIGLFLEVPIATRQQAKAQHRSSE